MKFKRMRLLIVSLFLLQALTACNLSLARSTPYPNPYTNRDAKPNTNQHAHPDAHSHSNHHPHPDAHEYPYPLAPGKRGRPLSLKCWLPFP